MEARLGLADLARSTFDRRTRLDPDALRKSKPMRNPDVRTHDHEDGSSLLEAPLEDVARGIIRFLAKRSSEPRTKKFELEPIGAFVWGLCDGKTTFETISRKLREKYKMNRLEADAALIAFLQMLAQRGLVTLMVEDKSR
jgi:hypothetical protein